MDKDIKEMASFCGIEKQDQKGHWMICILSPGHEGKHQDNNGIEFLMSWENDEPYEEEK